MDQQNLDGNIYQNSKIIDKTENYFYTLKGFEDFIDDSGFFRIINENNKKIFAKKHKNINEKYRFLILVNNYHKLYNPVSIYGYERQDPFENKNIRSDKKFIEVNEDCFNYYITFLATKNILWLTKAERET